MKKYKPQIAKSKSWDEIEKIYLKLIGHGVKYEPMFNLINHIRRTNLNQRLFAYTSMHKLVVGIYDEIEWNREVLHIEFDTETRKWFFKYISKPFESNAYSKMCNEDLGTEKFDHFIKKINW